jgi:hypothetical protein
MAEKKQKLELTWIGKEKKQGCEQMRIILNDNIL